jgi:hypothetical protein
VSARREFLVTPVRQCRHCGCTPETPCRLYNNDECCWRNAAQDLCTNPKCYRAEERASREIERKRKQDVAARVLPIAERWALARSRDAEALRRKRKRQAKRNSEAKRNTRRLA